LCWQTVEQQFNPALAIASAVIGNRKTKDSIYSKMEKFEQILLKYNWPKRTEKPLTSIDQIENIIKFKLPTDYVTYIQNYFGFEASIVKEYVRLWPLEELIEMNMGYFIFDNLPKTIGIEGNGGGEFIAIELTDDDKYRIVLSPFIDLDKQYHIEIGTSFTDFLLRLDNGQEWFGE
jgi:hypothetical protein